MSPKAEAYAQQEVEKPAASQEGTSFSSRVKTYRLTGQTQSSATVKNDLPGFKPLEPEEAAAKIQNIGAPIEKLSPEKVIEERLNKKKNSPDVHDQAAFKAFVAPEANKKTGKVDLIWQGIKNPETIRTEELSKISAKKSNALDELAKIQLREEKRAEAAATKKDEAAKREKEAAAKKGNRDYKAEKEKPDPKVENEAKEDGKKKERLTAEIKRLEAEYDRTYSGKLPKSTTIAGKQGQLLDAIELLQGISESEAKAGKLTPERKTQLSVLGKTHQEIMDAAFHERQKTAQVRGESKNEAYRTVRRDEEYAERTKIPFEKIDWGKLTPQEAGQRVFAEWKAQGRDFRGDEAYREGSSRVNAARRAATLAEHPELMSPYERARQQLAQDQKKTDYQIETLSPGFIAMTQGEMTSRAARGGPQSIVRYLDLPDIKNMYAESPKAAAVVHKTAGDLVKDGVEKNICSALSSYAASSRTDADRVALGNAVRAEFKNNVEKFNAIAERTKNERIAIGFPQSVSFTKGDVTQKLSLRMDGDVLVLQEPEMAKAGAFDAASAQVAAHQATAVLEKEAFAALSPAEKANHIRALDTDNHQALIERARQNPHDLWSVAELWRQVEQERATIKGKYQITNDALWSMPPLGAFMTKEGMIYGRVGDEVTMVAREHPARSLFEKAHELSSVGKLCGLQIRDIEGGLGVTLRDLNGKELGQWNVTDVTSQNKALLDITEQSRKLVSSAPSPAAKP